MLATLTFRLNVMNEKGNYQTEMNVGYDINNLEVEIRKE